MYCRLTLCVCVSRIQGLYAGVNIIDVQLVGKYRGLSNDFASPEARDALDPAGEEFRLRSV